MRLSVFTPGVFEFTGRGPVLSPLVVGCVLLVGPAALTLGAPGPLTSSRVLGAVIIGAIGVGLVFAGWPRARRVRIFPELAMVQVGNGAPSPIGSDAAFRLVDAAPERPTGPARYGVMLERRLEASVLLLASSHPDVVLRSLSLVRDVLGLRVRSGWGLSAADSAWLDLGSTPSVSTRPPAFAPDPPDPNAKRRVTTAMIASWAGVSGLIVLEITGRLRQGDDLYWVSVLLPVIAVTVFGAVTLVVATGKRRLALGGELACERFVCGVRYRRQAVARTRIRRAALVSPDGNAPRDLLVQTDEGLVSFPCEAQEGPRLLAELARSSS
jgi:hypothetical protein